VTREDQVRVRQKEKWFQVTCFPARSPAAHARRERGGLFSRTASLSLPVAVFPGCDSTLQSLSASQTSRIPAARAGLLLACRDLPSPVSPRQGYCSRPNTSLAPICQLRTRSVARSQPRPFPVRGCSQLETRCSRFADRPSHPLLPSLPFGTFIPRDRPSLRLAFAPGGSAYEKAYREATPDLPSLPAGEFLRLR